MPLGRVRGPSRHTPSGPCGDGVWEKSWGFPKLTSLSLRSAGGHSRAEDKPEGTPGHEGATLGALRTASVGAERGVSRDRRPGGGLG